MESPGSCMGLSIVVFLILNFLFLSNFPIFPIFNNLFLFFTKILWQDHLKFIIIETATVVILSTVILMKARFFHEAEQYAGHDPGRRKRKPPP